MTPANLDKILTDWWQANVANSIVSRSTAVHNYLQPKFEELKKTLRDELAPPVKSKSAGGSPVTTVLPQNETKND